MIQRSKSQGFTLIELMLSMAFVATLLVTIATTSMIVVNTYNKGVTIREVNQAGRLVTEDIQRTIASTSPFSVVPKTGGSSDPSDSKYVVQAGGGRLCTGEYTYAWNYGKTRELSGDGTLPPVYNTYQGGGEAIRFVKVYDTGGVLCANVTQQIPREQTKELVVAGDRNLAVQSFSITAAAEGRDDASGQAIYAINLVLGTNDRQQVNPTATACLPPQEGVGVESFCAINQFSIVVRAGNRSGSIQ